MKTSNIVYALWICFSLSCCKPINKQEAIAQKWKIAAVDYLKNDTIPKNSDVEKINVQIVYEFKKDGNYTIVRDNQADWGTWELSTDGKILTLQSAQHPQDNEEFLIETLTDFSLIVVAENKDKKERIQFLPTD